MGLRPRRGHPLRSLFAPVRREAAWQPPDTCETARPRAPDATPKLTQRPWAGFTSHDGPRDQPLDVCPSARCRRARQCLAALDNLYCRRTRQCLAALDNLYCRRTHMSLAELAEHRRASALQKRLDAVPEVIDAHDLSERAERFAELAAIRIAHERDMLARWKAGGLDHLYGKYRRGGVLIAPPPREYVDKRKK